MVDVIFGEKGTGKTKRILELANGAVGRAKGSIVFIDDDNSYMYDLKRDVRFINATEYTIVTPKMLYGFICGMAAMDFDLEEIYIDGFMHFVHHDLSTLELFFSDLTSFAEKRGIHVTLSISGTASELPPYIAALIMHTT